jgi:hypothetical protein
MKDLNNELRLLAQQNPKELIRIITSLNGNVKTLTAGVEILGEETTDESLVIPVFRQLIKHSNALVREGTMNGMSVFFINKSPPEDIVERLRSMSINDPFPPNKDIAKDLLNKFESK